MRFAQRILSEDLKKIGHAALEIARATIDKKLKLDLDPDDREPAGYLE